MRRLYIAFFTALICFSAIPLLEANQVSENSTTEFLLRDTFYLSHVVKLEREVFEVEGFTLVSHPAPDWNSSFAVVTGFKNDTLTTHILRDVNSVDEARKYFTKKVVAHDVHGMSVRELSLPAKGGTETKLYWVGNRAFRSLEEAEKSLGLIKKAIEDHGGNFEQAVQKVHEVSKEPPLPKKTSPPLRTELEEEFAIKALDWLGFTEYFYGPFYGEPSGERILYQSTFEGSYRTTNFDKRNFGSDTAFWSHRLVFRGIRFVAGTTLDPYVEAIPSVQTDGRDFATNLEVGAGIEWRPFIRSAILQNYQPYGLPILDWIRNTRLFIVYSQRHNIKDKYSDDVKTHNLRAGVGLFKEWGIDLPGFDVFSHQSPYFKGDDLFWGEVFSEFFYNKTNFSAEPDYQSIQSTVAFKFGLKLPRFPLRNNPVNQEFLLMPYFVFENNVNYEHSFSFQNRFYYGWGVRWMPFRDYRFLNNEWLFKTKFFFEYYQNIHYGQEKPVGEVPEKDIRLGVNVSLKRF